MAIGKLDEAIADFNSLLELEPNRTEAYNNRGLAALQMGDFDAAVADFSAAIDRDPTLAFAYNNRGVAWRRKGSADLCGLRRCSATSDTNPARSFMNGGSRSLR